MDYKKSLLVFCVIICILFTVSSVAAGDVNDAAIASENQDMIEIENQDSVDVNGATGEIDDANQKIESDVISSSNEDILSEKDNGTFKALQEKINNATEGSTITLENDYTYDEGFDTGGIVINKDLTINGKGHTLNGLSKSNIFTVIQREYSYSTVSLLLNNITFTNGKTAVTNHDNNHKYQLNDLTIKNCVFTNNKGSAIENYYDNLKVQNCVFTNNGASGSNGGAIYSEDAQHPYNYYYINVSIENSVFNNNHANCGGAIYNLESYYFQVKNCIFTNNNANYGGAIYNERSSSIKGCTFTDNQAKVRGGAVYIKPYVEQWFGAGIRSREIVYLYNLVENSKFITNNAKEAGAIFVKQYGRNLEDVDAKSCTFDNNRGNDGNEVVGIKTINCLFKKTVLSASKVTATYKVSKNLVVTLKDSNGQVLKSKKVKIKVGTISKKLTTDSKGQVSVDVSKLAPKTYTATVTYAGDSNHYKSTKKVKVTVKKATPKLAAKSKSFKKSVKTKRYTVTLKTKKNKAIKKVKVTLKIKGKKAITAKTNKKGVATFKIKTLKKKGTFKSTVTFKGNKYYNKVTKKVNIKIK